MQASMLVESLSVRVAYVARSSKFNRGKACLQFDIFDGVAHADRQWSAMHQKLNGIVELLC